MTNPAITGLRQRLQAVAVPSDAAPMAAYMKDHFPFLGVKTPARRAASKGLVRSTDRLPLSEVVDLVEECWRQPEREFQHVGCDIVSRQAKRFDPGHLGDLERWVSTRSWWDTVDALSAHGVGTLVRNHRECAPSMDAWVRSDDIWIARSAILHQLRWKGDTDEERLFRLVLARAHETEFFLRKAQGWALREYAKVEPDSVAHFVAAHESELSTLTRREALKNLR